MRPAASGRRVHGTARSGPRQEREATLVQRQAQCTSRGGRVGKRQPAAALRDRAGSSTLQEPLILTEVRGDLARRTALITLNRPKQLNALNDALMDQLGQALLEFDADAGIGCIVVTGSDKAFAAGADIAAMATKTYMQAHQGEFITRNWETMRRAREDLLA